MSKHQTTNILEEAFPKLTVLGKRLQPLVLPTKPGRYTDNGGDSWTLDDDGHWYDHTGITKPIDDNWQLVLVCAPFTFVGE